jgi:hypothetical protein
MLNKSDAKIFREVSMGGRFGKSLMRRYSGKCPWAVDLENMAMPSARLRSAKPE